MAQIRLVRTLPATRPLVDRTGVDDSRARRGYTVQAAASTIKRCCRFCGQYHRARLCGAPIRRGFGWPGWENVTPEREALALRGEPSKAKQRRMATFAAPRSSTGVKRVPSTLPMPRPFLTSMGTPTKPQ